MGFVLFCSDSISQGLAPEWSSNLNFGNIKRKKALMNFLRGINYVELKSLFLMLEESFSFSPLSVMLAVDLSYMAL